VRSSCACVICASQASPILVSTITREDYRFYLMQAHADDVIEDLKTHQLARITGFRRQYARQNLSCHGREIAGRNQASLEHLGFVELPGIGRPW